MKHTITIITLSSAFLTAFLIHPRTSQSTDPFDAAIQQIDTQSKELNQQVIARQEDGLAHQKILRLELELNSLRTEHTQEIVTLKKQHEQEVETLKKTSAQTQQIHAQCTAQSKKLEKELSDTRAQNSINEATIIQLKNQIEQLRQELTLLTPPEHSAQQKEKNAESEISTLE